MNYQQMAGILESNESNPQHDEHIREITILIEQAIRDLTPLIVREELEKMKWELPIHIQTEINGKKLAFPDITAYIKESIVREIRKL